MGLEKLQLTSQGIAAAACSYPRSLTCLLLYLANAVVCLVKPKKFDHYDLIQDWLFIGRINSEFQNN